MGYLPVTVNGPSFLRQGLCARRWWVDDEGNGLVGVLAVGAQAGSDLADAGLVQQTDGRVAQQGHDGRSLTHMDQAGVLVEGGVLAPMELILDRPVAAPQGEGCAASAWAGARLVMP